MKTCQLRFAAPKVAKGGGFCLQVRGRANIRRPLCMFCVQQQAHYEEGAGAEAWALLVDCPCRDLARLGAEKVNTVAESSREDGADEAGAEGLPVAGAIHQLRRVAPRNIGGDPHSQRKVILDLQRTAEAGRHAGTISNDGGTRVPTAATSMRG